MENYWFKRWGWIYRPASIVGWILFFILLALIVHVFRIIDMHSHSGSDTLINVFPWAWIGFATLGWIASKTSR